MANLTQQQLIEAVWTDALAQIRVGSLEIVITNTVRDFIGRSGIVAIADRFR